MNYQLPTPGNLQVSYTCLQSFLTKKKKIGSSLETSHTRYKSSQESYHPAWISLPFPQGCYKTLLSALLKSRHFFYSIPLIKQAGKLIKIGNKHSFVFLALGEPVFLFSDHSHSFEFIRNHLLNSLSGVFLGVVIELINIQNPRPLLYSFFFFSWYSEYFLLSGHLAPIAFFKIYSSLLVKVLQFHPQIPWWLLT